MVDITIQNDRVLFRVEGLHKLWAMRSELDIPLAHIVGVEKKLIIQVADPAASAAKLEAAMGGPRSVSR